MTLSSITITTICYDGVPRRSFTCPMQPGWQLESPLALLPEGLLCSLPGVPGLMAWWEIGHLELGKVLENDQWNPCLNIGLRSQQNLFSFGVKWRLVNSNNPHFIQVPLTGCAAPKLLVEVVRHYALGGGKTATIGTARGLELLNAALGRGTAGKQPARLRQTEVPYLDIPSLAATFPRVEGITEFGIVLCAAGVCYEQPESYCIPWLRIATVELHEVNGIAFLRIGELTDNDEVHANPATACRPSPLLYHALPLTGYAVPAELIAAIIWYYRFGEGDTITIGVASQLARTAFIFGLGEWAEVERAELLEWLDRHVLYASGLDFEGEPISIMEDKIDEEVRQWARHAPYDELELLLELIAAGPVFTVDEVNGGWGAYDCTISATLAEWGRRDLPRFLDLVAPYLQSTLARPALLMAFGELGIETLPCLCQLVEQAAAWSIDNAEFLADALNDIGSEEARVLLQRLWKVQPAIQAYLERLNYVRNGEVDKEK